MVIGGESTSDREVLRCFLEVLCLEMRGRIFAVDAATDPAGRDLRAAPCPHDPFADIEGVEAFIFGSWVARYTGEPSPAPADVDVLVVGAADPDDLDKVAKKAQAILCHPVSIRRIRPETWNASNPTDPFTGSVKLRPLVTIVGGSRASGKATQEVGAG